MIHVCYFWLPRVPKSKWALQRAKFIIEHEYSVVGILDKMNETLHVLEQYVPRFFTGSTKIFYGKGNRDNRVKFPT